MTSVEAVEQFIALVEAADMPAHDKRIVFGETLRTLSEGAHDYGVDIYGDAVALDDGDSEDAGDYSDDAGDTMDDGDGGDDLDMDDGADGDELDEHTPMQTIHSHGSRGLHAHCLGDPSVEHESGTPETDRALDDYHAMMASVSHAQIRTAQAQGPAARPGVFVAPGLGNRKFAEKTAKRTRRLREGYDPAKHLSEGQAYRLEQQSEDTFQRLLAGE